MGGGGGALFYLFFASFLVKFVHFKQFKLKFKLTVN